MANRDPDLPADTADVAAVRLQVVQLLMGQAIGAFAEVHERQKAQVEIMTDLVNRSTALLQEGPPMTTEDLSDKLGVDPEILAEALDSAVNRGELLQEARYFM